MGRDNHNAGMHFVHYTTKVSDGDAVAYIQKKENGREQAATKEKYDDLLKYDNPCHLKRKEMTTKVHVNHETDQDNTDWSMYRYRIKNVKKKENKLTLWVGYDLGGKNYLTGEILFLFYK